MRPTAAMGGCHRAGEAATPTLRPPLKGERVARLRARKRREGERDGMADSSPPAAPRAATPPCRAGEEKSLRRLGVAHVAPAVAAHAHIRLLGVAEEAFEHAQP